MEIGDKLQVFVDECVPGLKWGETVEVEVIDLDVKVNTTGLNRYLAVVTSENGLGQLVFLFGDVLSAFSDPNED